MSAPLEWELRLKNEVSAAAKAAGLDMKAFAAAVAEAQGHVGKLEQAERKEAGAARETKKAHESMFGDVFEAEVLKDGIEELVHSVGELGLEFAKSTIEATDFEFKAKIGLEHLTGSAEVTEDVMERARAFANGVGEDVDKTTDAFAKLAATGLRGDQLTAAAAAAKDLGDANRVSFDQTAQLFEMIGSDRGLGGRAVRQLQQFPGLLNELERHFGFVPGTSKSFEQLTKHLDEAPIKGAAGLALLESEITKVYHEGALGDVGVETGKSFEGAFTKIRNDWKEALGSMADDPAIVKLRNDINEFADFFNPSNEGGKELHATLKALGETADKAFRFFKDNPDVIKGVFDSAIVVAHVLEWTLEKIVGLIKDTQSVGAFWGTLAGGGSLEDAKLARANAQHGTESAEQRADREAGLAHRQAVPDLAPLPSKADGGSVQSTGLVTVHAGEEIVPAGVTAGGGGGGGGHSFHFHISVDNSGHTGGQPMDEQALAAKIDELVRGRSSMCWSR